jgi:hypothetical protein
LQLAKSFGGPGWQSQVGKSLPSTKNILIRALGFPVKEKQFKDWKSAISWNSKLYARSEELGIFLAQIGIFLLLVVGIGFTSKLLGKYSLYFLLALTFTVLIFAVLNTNDFSNWPFLYVVLFGTVFLASMIKLMIQTYKLK